MCLHMVNWVSDGVDRKFCPYSMCSSSSGRFGVDEGALVSVFVAARGLKLN